MQLEILCPQRGHEKLEIEDFFVKIPARPLAIPGHTLSTKLFKFHG
jgi:hypothetical protein